MRGAIAIIGLLALGGCAGDVSTIDQPSMYVSMADGGARLDPQAAASMISLYRQNNGLGGVAVDPQNAFLYTTNQGAGTVSQFSLAPACFASPGAPCFVGTIATGSGSTGGPFGIILAN